ncbi:MAG TPA: hypothetical protein VFU57_08690 [Candidatus Acidoferrales bacterium]|nr:hypothetical protein [Candidatus Acidoferrales bacterium]
MKDDGIGLDVRWPIGLLFSAMGAALGIYGAFFANAQRIWHFWVDLDLWWGLAMLIFGLAMLWGASRSSRQV